MMPTDAKLQSLAEYLGTAPGPAETTDVEPQLVDVNDPKAFALAVINSRDFRQYIVNQLTLGDLPPAILVRLMDYAWGKPVERVEHTGKDGGPVVTEIRRVIVRAPQDDDEDISDIENNESDPERTSVH